jgi:PAS domain S-box-containing protein
MEAAELWKTIRAVMEKGERIGGSAGRRADGGYGERILEDYARIVATKLEKKVSELEAALARRKAADEALRESEEKLRLALSGSDTGWWALDLRTSVGEIDDRAAGILGYRASDIGRRKVDWDEITHPEDLPAVQARLREYLGGGTAAFKTEHRMRHASGEWIWVLGIGKVTRRDGDGSPIQISGTMRDISDRKREERALAEALAEKEVLLKELQHRTKNNLNLVSTFLRLKMDDIRDDPLRSVLQEAIGRIESITTIYEQLCRSESVGRIRLRWYIESLASSLRAAYPTGQSSIVVSAGGEDITIAHTLAVALGLILNELVTNALKYAYPPGTSGEIRIEISREATGIRLRVADHGKGMPAVLDPMTATSLGLRIARMLAQQIGATLRFEAGKGTAAVIDVPEAGVVEA